MVRVRQSIFTVRASRDSRTAILSRGMPTSEHLTIFERFVGMLAKNPVATGLGLALVALAVVSKRLLDSKDKEIAAGEVRETKLASDLKTANERLQEMGERVAVLAHESLRQAPDLKWLRRWINEQIRLEDSRPTPKPKTKTEATSP